MSCVSRQLFADKVAGLLRTKEDDSNKRWALAAKIGLPLLGLAAGGALWRGRYWKKAHNKVAQEYVASQAITSAYLQDWAKKLEAVQQQFK